MTPLLLVAALASVQGAPPAASEAPNEVAPVVVTLPDPDRARSNLAACIARDCPPGEDMTLTLRSAEADFLRGQYRTARLTLDAAIRRNRRHGRTHPVLLAGVYKADNTVNRHLGRGDEAHRSAREASVLLAHRYGDASPEALWADLDAADALLNARRVASARAAYHRLEDAAEKSGLSRLGDLVSLRLAWLPAMEGRPEIARARLQRISEGAGPGKTALATSAALLLIKLTPRDKQDAAAARLVADYRARAAGLPEPVLLWAPPLDRRQEQALLAALASIGSPPPSVPDPSGWIDVGFFIDANGRVVEAEVLRQGPGRNSWREEALDLIRRRVYAPAAGMEPGERIFRLERVAFTSLLGRGRTGSRLPSRSIATELHNTDLTRVATGGEP